MSRSRLVDDTPYRPSDPPTERSVVAELYYQARVAGLTPILEVSFELPPEWRFYADTHRVIRADLGIVKNEEVVALVEVKRTGDPARRQGKTRSFVGKAVQSDMYDATGLPWRYCVGMDDIPDTVAWLTQFR